MRLILPLASLLVALAAPAAAREADAQIVQKIIRESLASYPGTCPCPYNSDRAGRRCGGRSALSESADERAI